jgi:N-formylglutamate deformylase
MGRRYPFLITVPHGGEQVPPEVTDRIALSREELLTNSDPRTLAIYDFGARVEATVAFPVARPVIDVNRAPTDLPPANPDGVVKSVTPLGFRVYRPGRFPDRSLILILLRRYYYPYHRTIHRALLGDRISIAFDCHSMLPTSPPRFPDAGTKRPLVCLGNRGDPQGRQVPGTEPVTCPPEWICGLADAFREVFPGEGDVTINDPFPGGFTLRFHHRQTTTPWIQIEINRALYENSDDSEGDLRDAVFSALTAFWDETVGYAPGGKRLR